MSLDFIIKTETAHDGTFTGMAFVRDNSAMRIVARDVANGHPTRAIARGWATRASKAQRSQREAKL